MPTPAPRIIASAAVNAELDKLEATFLKQAQQPLNGIVQSLILQAGSKTLALPTKQLKDLARAYSIHQQHTAIFGRAQARKLVADAKAKQFAVDPAAIYYPNVGVDWYDTYALKLVGITQTAILDKAQAIIAQGVVDGLSQRKVMKQLEEVLPGFSKHRLENITRTETSKIYSQAKWRELDSFDEVIGYEYVAIVDTRTSPICKYRDGKKIRKNDIEGWLPPAHYMCRSTITPIFDWEETPDFVDPKAGIQPKDNFGSTSMAIPEPKTPAEKRAVKQISK